SSCVESDDLHVGPCVSSIAEPSGVRYRKGLDHGQRQLRFRAPHGRSALVGGSYHHRSAFWRRDAIGTERAWLGRRIRAECSAGEVEVLAPTVELDDTHAPGLAEEEEADVKFGV